MSSRITATPSPPAWDKLHSLRNRAVMRVLSPPKKPLFFNIAPREALSMSLHQRLVLQESWKALEEAGYNPKDLAETQVGMFIGAEPTGYFYETFTGASDAIVASRLFYFLNLNGPALT